MSRHGHADCPFCFSEMENYKCQSCGVAIGTAKGKKGKIAERTVASPGAEEIGRKLLPDNLLVEVERTDPLGDDEAEERLAHAGIDVDRVIGAGYTAPPPRWGVVSSPVKEPQL
jgi:hypothetical protein